MTQLQEREQAAPTRSDTEMTRETRQYVPDVDIFETDDKLVLKADMPGVNADDLDIRLEKNILSIYGNRRPMDVGERQLVAAEYEPGSYYRAFTLSEEVDQEKIEASLENGVLTLHLPKAEQAKPRKIAVASK